MKIEEIYQNEDLLIVNKPAGIIVFRENDSQKKSLIDFLIEKYPALKNTGTTPRYGAIHRLDKDTSGIILIAKNNQSLIFFQKEFKKRRVEKTYLALISGKIKEDKGEIRTLIHRDKTGLKQKAYPITSPFLKKKGSRIAETLWEKEKEFKEFTLIKVFPKTGRKHQIRVHLKYINHPIVGDKIYSFKNQKIPKGLERQFLHAHSLKLKLPDGETREFIAKLLNNLKKVLKNI